MDTGKVPYCGVRVAVLLGWDGGYDINFDSMKTGLESGSEWIPILRVTVRGPSDARGGRES